MIGEPATLEGTLDDLSLATLLRLLSARGRSGNLHLSGATPILIRMHEGRLDFAAGSDLSVLHRHVPKLDEDEWISLTARETSPERAISAVLGARSVDRKAAVEGVRAQAVATLFEFAVPNGDAFSFHEVDEGSFHDGFDLEEVLASVDDQIEAWREIATSVPSTAAVFAMAADLPGEITEVRVGPEEWQVLAAMDGKKNVAQLIETLNQDPFKTCNTIHRLTQTNLAELKEA